MVGEGIVCEWMVHLVLLLELNGVANQMVDGVKDFIEKNVAC